MIFSTLLKENIAYDRLEAIFTCTVRSLSKILSWGSLSYIDDMLQVVSVDRPGHIECNPNYPMFVILTSSTTNDEGVFIIISQLQL